MDNSVTLTEVIRNMTIPDIATIALSLIVGLICLGGIIFAAIRWKRHRAVSTITGFALLLTAISAVTMPILRLYVTESVIMKIFANDRAKFEEKLQDAALYSRNLPSVFETVESSVQIIILILFLFAIFLWRAKENPNPIQKQ